MSPNSERKKNAEKCIEENVFLKNVMEKVFFSKIHMKPDLTAKCQHNSKVWDCSLLALIIEHSFMLVT